MDTTLVDEKIKELYLSYRTIAIVGASPDSKKTSIFSAAPGALGPLLILAEDEKSDLSQVATSHLIRLIIIITVFPSNKLMFLFYLIKKILPYSSCFQPSKS